ncbi:MAG: hypothetical protein DBX59_05905 [Bacillota bacterium]|nr:MAG: hypothetical protein DBX59_05905 [Bacillota bacterium]
MKNKLCILLKMQLLGSFGINKMLYGKKKGKKTGLGASVAALAALFLLIEAFVCLYAWLIAAAAGQTGAGRAYMPLVFAFVSVILFFFTAANVGGRVFGVRDYEMTGSLPVGTKQIAAAKLLFIYAENLAVTLCVVVPFWAFGGAMLRFSAETHLCVFLLLFFAPLLPSALAVAFGTLLAVLTARLKRKELFQTVLFAVFFAAAIVLSAVLSFHQPQEVSLELPAWLCAPFEKFWAAGVYALASAAVFAVPCLLVGKYFTAVNTLILSRKASAKYEKKELKSSSRFAALFKKEIKRLFSCTEYAVNTLFGVLMVAVFPLIFFFSFGWDLSSVRAAVGEYGSVAAAGAGVFASLMPTTYCSIALEGKNLWILRSAPVPARTVLFSKLAVHLVTETLPAAVVCAVYGAIAGMGAGHIVLAVFVSAVFSAAFGVIALLLNLKFPALEWEKEVVPVKRSRACLFVMLVDFVLTMLIFVVGIALSSVNAWLNCVVLLALGGALLSGTLYLLSTKGEKMFRALID